MTHWGWYWRVKRQHTPKSLCSHFNHIDAFQQFKIKGFIGFSVVKGEKEVAKAVLEDNHLKVTLENLSYNIPFEKQPCNFGGFRYFYRCPGVKCNRRMRILYDSNGIFVCRKCLNLGYYSQRIIPSHRFWLMERKLSEKLEKLGGSLYSKPKWMRERTFKKLKAKGNDLYWKGEAAVYEEVFKMYGQYP